MTEHTFIISTTTKTNGCDKLNRKREIGTTSIYSALHVEYRPLNVILSSVAMFRAFSFDMSKDDFLLAYSRAEEEIASSMEKSVRIQELECNSTR